MSQRPTRIIALVAALIALVLAFILPFVLRDKSGGLQELESALGTDDLEQMLGHDSPDDAGADNGADGATARPENIVTIQGQVVSPTGEPIPGATISAQASQINDLFETTSDAGGLFAFSELPLALYAVEAIAPDYGPAITIGVVPGGASLRLVLESGAAIDGLVTRDDQPVPSAVVHLGGPGTFPQRSVETDASGRFQIAGLRAGSYQVVATATGLGSGFTNVVFLDDVANGQMRVDIALEPAPEFTLHTVDYRTGDSVTGGVITISNGPLHVISLSRTIEYGVTLVDFLPRGDYWVRVRAPGYLPYEGPLEVRSIDETVRLELTRGAAVRGTISDLAGNGVSMVSVSAIVETADGGRWEMRRSVFDEFHRLVRPDGGPFWPPSMGFMSRPDGTFNLNGLPAGQAWIVAQRDGYAPAVSQALTLQENSIYDNVDLVLEQGRAIRGRVVDSSGGGISGASVAFRYTSVPEWAIGDTEVTDGVGMFALTDVPSVVIVTVRHPDFGSAVIELEIPIEGLDDVIIQLSGEQLPHISGRVFTQRGAIASGALVWLMHGESELPVCRATVGSDGWFRASHCSAAPERIVISHAQHAPLIAELGGNLDPQDWNLSIGGELEVISQRNPLVADVRPLIPLPEALWPRPQLDLDRWSRQIIPAVTPGRYEVTCRAEGFDPALIEAVVVAGQRAEALCPHMERVVAVTLYAVDPQGAPVSNVLIMIDGLDQPIRELTNSDGRIELSAAPGQWAHVEALHDEWGRGTESFYVPYQESEPFRVVLGNSIAGDDPETFLDELDGWGVEATTDGRGVIIEGTRSRSPAEGLGIRRRDRLLWARAITDFRYSIGVRRDGEVMTFELVREPDGEN